VPAGLSGRGSIAIQLAKHMFHAAKVITTVSTAKVDQVTDLLGEGIVDQIVDYAKAEVLLQVENGSVDFDTRFDPILSAALEAQDGFDPLPINSSGRV
jgi:NADPH:quinone reductase-like Zn-dependent oxidoreductase